MDNAEYTKPHVVYNFRVLPSKVHSGDEYEFLYDMTTRAGHIHSKGSRIRVLDATTQAPYNEIGESGHNWICRTKYSVSVWATLEQCISRGLLRKI